MANNITEYLIQLQELTQTNLKILQTLNDSFYTSSEHLTVNIDDKTSYVIPSFITLENKINSLQSDFENLVNAPKTGEADFHFDGNSQSITLSGFSNTPFKLFLNNVSEFNINKNDVLKDFLTPEPYIRFNLEEIGNDINYVNIKKIIPKNQELKDLYSNLDLVQEEATIKINYSDLIKTLENYKEDVDYIMYDTLKHMPIKKNIGYGSYEIEAIINHQVENTFVEYYTLILANPLTYKIKDETIEQNLVIGDELVTYNDKVKMKIVDLNFNTRTITVEILNGGYANLVDNSNSNVELYTLKYFNNQNLNNSKYIDVPLEEDDKIFVFIAPVNDRIMTQSSWGQGLYIDVYKLKYSDGKNTYYFKDYYDMFVNNIGDALYGITSMIKHNLTNLTYDEYKNITSIKPSINPTNLVVTEINSHLNNSKDVQNIRALHAQKQNYKLELQSVQRDIDEVDAKLAALSFQDTTNTRTIYTAQLTQLNERKQELINTISSILQEITTSANESTVPIENAKYRIRGYFDWEGFLNSTEELQNLTVIKILVQYRYKNKDKVTGNALSIGKSEKGKSEFIFSDWNIFPTPFRKLLSEHDKTLFHFNYEKNNDNINEPSFNQIDIPITQGESVDLRLKVIYDLGYPYVETSSDWSEIINIEFPSELLKNVSILDIIQENNNDIKKDQFKGLLQSGGYTKHVNDLVVDQDITYFHHPDYISSGFYTAERRIIPLKDKLNEFNDDILTLKDEVFGTSSDDLELSIKDGNAVTNLIPYSNNIHLVTAYNDATKDGDEAVANIELTLTNKGNHNIKLFSIFPGNYEKELTNDSHGFLPTDNYTKTNKTGSLSGVYIQNTTDKDENKNLIEVHNQLYNQFLYFRLKDAYGGDFYYKQGDTRYLSDKLCSDKNKDFLFNTATTSDSTPNLPNAVLFPSIKTKSDLSTGLDNVKYKLLKPGESIHIDLIFKYRLQEEIRDEAAITPENPKVDTIQKTMSCDIRTSLYAEPVNYVFTIKANYNDSVEEKVKRTTKANKYNPVII